MDNMGKFVMYIDSDGNELVALPNARYYYKGSSYVSLDSLPIDLYEALHTNASLVHGFPRIGNCINVTFPVFDTAMVKNGIAYKNIITDIQGDKRLLINFSDSDEVLLLIDEEAI